MLPLLLLLFLLITGGGFVRFAVADVNGDGSLEVAAYDGMIKVFNLEGELLYKWNYKLSSDMAVADLNGDGMEELLFGTEDGRLIALNAKGKVWSIRTGTPVVAKPAIGKEGVVVVDFRGVLYLISSDGKVKFKMRMLGCCCHVQNQPALGDLDGDGKDEIVVATDPGRVFIISNRRVSRNFTLGGFPSKPKVVNGTLYLGVRGLILAGDKRIELEPDEYPLDYGPEGWITTKRVTYLGREVYRGSIKAGILEPYPVFATNEGLYSYNGSLVKLDDGEFLIQVRDSKVFALSKHGFKLHVLTENERVEEPEVVEGNSVWIPLMLTAVILTLVIWSRRR